MALIAVRYQKREIVIAVCEVCPHAWLLENQPAPIKSSLAVSLPPVRIVNSSQVSKLPAACPSRKCRSRKWNKPREKQQ